MVYFNHYENLKSIFELFYGGKLDKEKLTELIEDLAHQSEYYETLREREDNFDLEDEEIIERILSTQEEFEDFMGYIFFGHINNELWEYISNDYKDEDFES